MSNGGIIGPKNNTSETTATGFWSISEQYSKEKAGLWPKLEIVRENLILWLDAGNTSSYPGSGADWFDISQNSYHMKLYNSPSFVSSGTQSYFDLDGTDDHGICDGTVSGSLSATVDALGVGGASEKTVVCIARVDSGVGSTAGGLFDLGDSGSAGRHYSLRLLNDYATWRAQFWSTPDYDFSYDTTTKWTMFSVVYGADKIGKTYINNGTLIGQDSGPYDLVTSGSRQFQMGRYSLTSYFGGKIAMYAVYNKGLSVSEIQQNYQAYKDRYNLV